MLHLPLASGLVLTLLAGALGDVVHSFNVSNCPGYSLHSLLETSDGGLTAKLELAGPACNAFGVDVVNLTIEVNYETETRLHVNIYDTTKSQFTIPETVIAKPQVSTSDDIASKSDLVFNYESKPFAFWITRCSASDAAPLFNTRVASLPKTPIPPVMGNDPSTALDSFQLVFENQYIQLTSALPLGANIYGLGEVISSSGIRRDVGTDGGIGTIQTNWARDIQDPINQNMYGVHPIYMEHRLDSVTGIAQSHGVFLFNANGADILLLTPPTSTASLIQYHLIGGTLSLYFLSGPNPLNVIEQYAAVVGTPTWQPYWGFGFHLCRWGYTNVNETREVVARMREAEVPLEVMWNDIDLYHSFRDFTVDPVKFPAQEMREFIRDLRANNQHFIPIVDAAIGKETNSTDIYDPYSKGAELDVFIKNPDGTEYIGQVWPGYTVFPDWFAPNTLGWWTQALKNWSALGIEFSGIWLDMNEASSFCDVRGCGTGIDISNTSMPFLLPGDPDNPILDYPEGYNATISGPSGNISVNGTLTYGAGAMAVSLFKRGVGAGGQTGFVDLNTPPYAIHNGNFRLSNHTLATNATHAGGYRELDVHNLLKAVLPGQRPFIISRSAFASAGKWAGHWLGDNYSLWQYMHFSIQGILQHQMFQIPFVGADTCGFQGNTDEELSFTPFYRNHNQRGAISQEPFVWDSVAAASRTAITIRYALLPYWYSLFANASMHGTPPVRALFWELPDEPELFSVDRQFLVGSAILVTPVLTPNVSSVDGILPGRGKIVWRDWYTHEVVNGTAGTNTTLAAPLGHINVHVRDGAALLLHQTPGYTVAETRQSAFSLLVTHSADGRAFGSTYLDDGVSDPPGPNTVITVYSSKNSVKISSKGAFHVAQKLAEVTVLGVPQKPKIVMSGLSVDLNVETTTIEWT
ncbi:glycosyl hydrolases family 31-domain-containing protein [Mycena haematopus]|nr:glycosyl hydrolases family 31-domain-containing protein [Mycena haematopus]